MEYNVYSHNYDYHYFLEKEMKKSYIINNEPFELLIPNYPKGYDLTILDKLLEHISSVFRLSYTDSQGFMVVTDEELPFE